MKLLKMKSSALTLAEARHERTKARALVKQDTNPAHNRQLECIAKFDLVLDRDLCQAG